MEVSVDTCSICTENYTGKPVCCSKCQESSCILCFQKYLMNSTLTPTCMFCKTPVSNDFVANNTYIYWRQNRYREYREDLLFNCEKARLPEDQHNAQIYIKAKEECRRLENKHVALLYNTNITKKIYLDIVKRFGKPYDESEKNSSCVVPILTKACPSLTCNGFLNKDFICGLCSCAVCVDCHEIKTVAHTCLKETVLSVKAIKAEAKNCPSCATIISKIDGCDQMWCTQCHVTFSWRTGLKEVGMTHNPHFYEWLRTNNSGVIPRNPEDGCNDYPQSYDIFNSFDNDARQKTVSLTFTNAEKIVATASASASTASASSASASASSATASASTASAKAKAKAKARVAGALLVILTEYHRHIIHIDSIIKNLLITTPPDNYSLRIRFLTNELKADMFKVLIYERDRIHSRELNKYQIYDMVYMAAGDLFRNLIAKQSPFEIKISLQKLFAYGNECLRSVDDRYSCMCTKYSYY